MPIPTMSGGVWTHCVCPCTLGASTGVAPEGVGEKGSGEGGRHIGSQPSTPRLAGLPAAHTTPGGGPRGGPVEGVRYSLTLSAPLELTMAVYASQLTRHLVDPTAAVGQRDVGTAKQSVLIADAGFNLRITGAKTWHGFVPYVGFSLGIADGSAVPEDVSLFVFNRPFQFGPHLGVRYYAGSSASLWVEGWDPMWRLRHPLTFFTNPSAATPALGPSGQGQTQWAPKPTLMVGIGIATGS